MNVNGAFTVPPAPRSVRTGGPHHSHGCCLFHCQIRFKSCVYYGFRLSEDTKACGPHRYTHALPHQIVKPVQHATTNSRTRELKSGFETMLHYFQQGPLLRLPPARNIHRST